MREKMAHYNNPYPSWPPQQQQQQQQPPPSGHGPPTPPPPSLAAAAGAGAAPWQQQNPYFPPPQVGSGYAQPSGYPQHAGYPQSSGYPQPSPYPPPLYPGNPSAPGAYHLFPPGTDPEAIRLFQDADRDASGTADEAELHRVLSSFNPFTLRTVRLMIHLFGSNNATKLGPTEFASLFKALKEWKGIFERFDRDRSGSIDKTEMRDALLSLGYSVSPPILDCLLSKYDKSGKGKATDYDSFVECGLIVKGLTEKFKGQDKQMKGSATLDYQTFMLMVVPFIVA